MKRALITVCLTALVCLPAVETAAQTPGDDVLALHWHPATQDRARNRTLAAVAWLERGGEAADWQQAIDAVALRLQPSQERMGPVDVALIDGLLPWLVRQRRVNLGQWGSGFPEPDLGRIEALLERDHADGQIARQRVRAAHRAEAVWSRVAAALGESAGDELEAYWAPLLEELAAAEADEDPALEYARAQASRVRALTAAETPAERLRAHDAMIRAQALNAARTGQLLDAIWLAFEGLARLTQADESINALAAEWSTWLASLETEASDAMRLIDIDLPVVLALLGDAADYLAAPGRARQSAIAELADTYARLALFTPDLAFYLDQPVREPVRRAISNCNPDPLLVGPLPRDVFERCARDLEGLLESGLDSEELVGGADGPFAPEFLRRELGLVSWQRAAYIDGHLNWLLGAQCQSPQWVNVMEWSLLADHLVRWVAQRPVFFTGSEWGDALARLSAQMREQAAAHVEWIDCLTGTGSERRDPVARLVDLHRQALTDVAGLLREARQAYYDSRTRPGADVDLDGAADQVTAYRPQDLSVGPCPEAASCGARAELPVSRALLGLFPNAFLLADQIGSGQLRLCYDQVRWVERSREPARDDNSQVANYYGRLSFDLVGTFGPESDSPSEAGQTVFRYRLTDSEIRHYLFAANDEAILSQDCPLDQIGRAVASSLPEGHPGLVPNRLTYFTSTPTTPESELVANWDQGAEWRDWFVTGRRVAQIDAADPAEMETAVQAELASLVAQRERQLVAPLINPPRMGDADPTVLAMARVADTAALLRRVLELHYPRLIRQHAPLRALLAGESGLITRDRVRQLRDSGVDASRMPSLGLERVDRFTNAWESLPASLREQGQRPPEIDYSLERLAELQPQSDQDQSGFMRTR
jgi:hypothetical protein